MHEKFRNKFKERLPTTLHLGMEPTEMSFFNGMSTGIVIMKFL